MPLFVYIPPLFVATIHTQNTNSHRPKVVTVNNTHAKSSVFDFSFRICKPTSLRFFFFFGEKTFNLTLNFHSLLFHAEKYLPTSVFYFWFAEAVNVEWTNLKPVSGDDKVQVVDFHMKKCWNGHR